MSQAALCDRNAEDGTAYINFCGIREHQPCVVKIIRFAIAIIRHEIDDPEGKAISGWFSSLKRIDGLQTPGADEVHVFHLPTFVADDKCTS